MTSLGAAALIEAVAQALTFAVNDPTGQSAAAPSSAFCHSLIAPCGGKKLRGAAETLQVVTVFDSSAIPPVGIDKYLLRLSRTFQCSEATFVAALIIVDRLLQFDGGRLPLTNRNVHRVFLGSLVVAVKYHEDLVYSNSHYAKAGGVHLREVNRLERLLLSALDFDLRISPEDYQCYEAMLLSRCDQSPDKLNLSIMSAGYCQPAEVSEAAASSQAASSLADNATKPAVLAGRDATLSSPASKGGQEKKGCGVYSDRGARRRCGRGGTRGGHWH